jgi:translocation and assembly module TamB
MRHWKRILFYFFFTCSLLFVGSSVWYLNSDGFQSRLLRSIEETASHQTGGRCRISSLQIHWFPPTLELHRFQLQKQDAEKAPPLLRVADISIQPGMAALFGRPRLRSVVLHSPEIQIEVNPDGTNNLPRPPKASADVDLFKIIIDRLTISRGNLAWNQQQWALETTLRSFSLGARYQAYPQSYHADLAYEGAHLKWEKYEWDCGLVLSLDVLENRLQIQKSSLIFSSAHLDFQGAVDNWHSPSGRILLNARLPVQILRPLYPRQFLRGQFALTGALLLEQGAWQSTGELEGHDVAVDIAQIAQFSCHYDATPREIRFDKIFIAGMGGRMEGQFRLESPLAIRHYQGDLKFQGIDLFALGRIAGFSQYNIAGNLQGELKASWGDQWKDFTGTGDLTVTPPVTLSDQLISPQSIPLGGRLTFSVKQWISTFTNSFLQLPHTRLGFHGSLSAAQVSNLALDFESRDLGDLSCLGLSLQGQASFRGAASGTFNDPHLSGVLQAESLSWDRWSMDRLKARLSATRQDITLMEGVLQNQHSQLNLQGRLGLTPALIPGLRDLDLKLTYHQAQLESLFLIMGVTPPISGNITGTCRLTGEYPNLELAGDSEILQVVVAGQPFDSGCFRFQGTPDHLQLPQFHFKAGAGEMEGRAELIPPEKRLHASLNATHFPLARIPRIQSSTPHLEGWLEKAQLQLDGDWEHPGVEGSVSLKEVFFSQELLGDFTVGLHTVNQILNFTIMGIAPAGTLASEGTLSLMEPFDLQAHAAFSRWHLTAYVQRFFPGLQTKLESLADGDAWISGSLSTPEKIKIKSTLRQLSFDFASTSLKAAQPLELEWENNRLSIKKGLFAGKGTSLSVDGEMDGNQANRLDLKLEGQMDLSLLDSFLPNLNAHGEGKVNAQIRGTLQDPRLRGDFILSNGQLSYGDLPNSLSDIQATLKFDENQVRIDRFNATSGGGQIQFGGNLLFGPQGIRQFDLNCHGKEVRLRYPEGMRNLLGLDLKIRGNQKAQILSGQITVLSASFLKDFDPITGFLGERGNRILLPGGKALGENLNLDLIVSANRSIRLDTPLVKLNSLADLRIKGTLSSPIITGRLEADAGDLYLQGAHYRINRGRLDFNNLVRLDPHIDLEAETRVRDYRVILNLTGTAEKFKADLRSEPPLPTVELINLVSSGGATNTDSFYSRNSDSFAPAGRHQDASASASALLSEGVSLKVGSRVKRIFGIDRFRIDPGLFGRPNERVARVTVGQQITRNLSITYSTTVAANEQQIILVEYDVNDSTSIIASRDAEGFFGIDLRFRKRLRQKGKSHDPQRQKN